MEPDIRNALGETAGFYTILKDNQIFAEQVADAYELMKETVRRGNTILIFGNGGSAAEAQHFAAELVGKFELERPAMNARALTTDSSILTAVGNDAGFEKIFSRQIEGYGKRGDLAIGLTTSDCRPDDGHSRNILNGFLAAKRMGLGSIGLFSLKTENLLYLVDAPIVVPSKNTAAIQEVHLFIIHRLCGWLENYFFANPNSR